MTPDSSVALPSRTRRTVLLYGAVALLYWAALFTYVPSLPTYAATFTPDLALVGMILAMYGLWQALVRWPMGIAADWVGWRKPFIIGGLALAALGALLMASATTPQALLIGRSITGMAAGTWVPLTVVFSALYPPEQAVRATTTLTVMSTVARVAATALNAPLNALRGYALPFVVAAVFAISAIVLVLPAGEARRQVKAPTLRGIARIALRRDVLLPALLSAVVHYVLQGLVFGLAPLLAKDLGASAALVSNLTVIHLAVLTPSVLASAFLVRRIGPRPLVLASFVAVAAGAACGALATSVAWLLALQVLIGIGFGVCYPILMGMSIEHVHADERTSAMGLHQSVYAVGMTAGPWLSGILAASIGLRPMFAVTAAGALVIGVAGALIATQSRHTRRD